jgi:hypothetical protein
VSDTVTPEIASLLLIFVCGIYVGAKLEQWLG